MAASSSDKASRLRRAWEKVVDVYDVANDRLDRVMSHPAGEFIVRQLTEYAGRKAGQSVADAHTRHQQRKFQASLPADSPWKVPEQK